MGAYSADPSTLMNNYKRYVTEFYSTLDPILKSPRTFEYHQTITGQEHEIVNPPNPVKFPHLCNLVSFVQNAINTFFHRVHVKRR